MMIRINLLPTRQVKKRGQSSQMLMLLAAAVVLAAGGNYVWYSQLQDESDTLARKIAGLQSQIEEKKRILKEVESINARRAEVEQKLAVLQGLREGRTGPVRMLDALAQATVKKVWLKDFIQSQSGCKLVGSASSNEDLADYMRSLSNVVWTPKGMGRLVDQRPGAKTSRVELLAVEGGVVEEFPVTEIKPFFSNIDLVRSEARSRQASNNQTERFVDFELGMSANYAI